MKTKTIILGAGISGLSAGYFLNKEDSDFLILEQSNRIGGNIYSEKINGFICENGPNTVLLNNNAIIKLIKDLKLWDNLCIPNKETSQNRFVLKDQKITKLPTSIWQILTTNILSIKDKLNLFKEPFIKRHKYDTSIAEFCKKRFGEGIYKNFIVPFITGIYAGNPEKISVKYGFKKIWNLEQYYGNISQGLMQKKSKNTIFTLPNGMSELTSSIEKTITNKLKINTSVNKIRKVKTNYYIETNNGSIECKNIICTLPAHVTAEIIHDEKLKKELHDINYVPVDVIHLGYDKNAIQDQNMGFGILTKPSDQKHFLGLLFSSKIFPNTAPLNQELLTVIIGGSRQPKLCSLKNLELQKIIINEVSSLLKINKQPDFIKQFKYPKGIPQYDLQHKNIIESVEEFRKSNPNFYFSANYIGGVSVSDCVEKSKKIINNL